jgi:hypothetical protein
VPGRGQDDVFDGDDGFEPAAPEGDPFVFDAEVSVFATSRGHRGNAQRALEIFCR